MAGEYQLPGELRQQDLDLLAACGLTVQVLVDCSYNEHVTTVRSDRPGRPIITKPIELDATLNASADPVKLSPALAAPISRGTRMPSPILLDIGHRPTHAECLQLRSHAEGRSFPPNQPTSVLAGHLISHRPPVAIRSVRR